MSDKPMLFSGPMVRAILREIDNPGTGKTQTRRVIEPTTKPMAAGQVLVTWGPQIGGTCARFAPRYAPGDRLYVREHWEADICFDDLAPRDMDPKTGIRFRADYGWKNSPPCRGRFRQGMHMPKWASRLTLIVTDVRVERLQDCSEADAKAEGIIGAGLIWGLGVEPPDPARAASPVKAYARLWDQINGPGAWASNPWVVALTFRAINANIDRLEATP